jgi:hypothetical protein
MISPVSFVTPAPESDVVFCDLDGEMALLHLQRGHYYGLNTVGARIWHLLGAGRSVAELRDTLMREFEVDASRCEADLLRILQQMADADLVKVQSGARP